MSVCSVYCVQVGPPSYGPQEQEAINENSDALLVELKLVFLHNLETIFSVSVCVSGEGGTHSQSCNFMSIGSHYILYMHSV